MQLFFFIGLCLPDPNKDQPEGGHTHEQLNDLVHVRDRDPGEHAKDCPGQNVGLRFLHDTTFPARRRTAPNCQAT